MARYSLRWLFISMGAVGGGLATLRYFGPVVSSYYALLVLIACGGLLPTVRIRAWLTGLTAMVSALGYFASVPGPGVVLPTLNLQILVVLFYPFYWCGEFPLNLIGNIFLGEFSEIIFFTGSFRVRPFIVFVFWFGIAEALAIPLVVTKIRSVRERRRFQQPSNVGRPGRFPAGRSAPRSAGSCSGPAIVYYADWRGGI